MNKTTVVSHLKIAENLAVARELLDCVGWTKGSYEVDGKVCALGAIHLAAGNDPCGVHSWPDDVGPTERVLQGADTLWSVVTQNDAPQTTKSSIKRRFTKAIKIALKNAKAAGEVLE